MHLVGLLPSDLAAELERRGVTCSEGDARRVLARVIAEGGPDPVPRHGARRPLVDGLKAHTTCERLTVLERVVDAADGSVRYLFQSPDGALSEAVRIGLHRPGFYTVCLSSQVGCAMACAFCATGRLGFSRNLEAWEIVAAFLTVRDEARLPAAGTAADGNAPGRCSSAVFMGQGEPFANYDAVIQAARVLADPCGGRIAKENITISTVGLVPQIRRYTAERQPYKLIVSLTSAVPERRAALLPVAGRTPLAELIDAIRDYAAVVKGRVTVAWVVLGGVNTGVDEVEALQELLGDLPLRVNLIDVNDGRLADAGGFSRATPGELKAFLDRLSVLNVPLVRRYSVGQSQDSACGMLAATRRPPEAAGCTPTPEPACPPPA